MLVSAAQLAENKGVTRQAVFSSSKTGTLQYAKKVGTKYNLEDPEVIAYLKDERDTRDPQKPIVKRDNVISPPQISNNLQDCDIGYIKKLKMIEDYREKDLKNKEREGALVSKEYVEYIFKETDGTLKSLLTEASQKLSIMIPSLTKAGKKQAEIRIAVEDIMSAHIKLLKNNLIKRLKALNNR